MKPSQRAQQSRFNEMEGSSSVKFIAGRTTKLRLGGLTSDGADIASDRANNSGNNPGDTSGEDSFEGDAELTAIAELYEQPVAPIRKHSAKYLSDRLKVKQIAEARLLRLSDELMHLADDVRYLNPLIADAIDEAWDSAEAALDMLTDAD
ncbi:MAG TPA: hypothetical protein V6C88_06870 [Chroococcidiopsis sp.]